MPDDIKFRCPENWIALLSHPTANDVPVGERFKNGVLAKMLYEAALLPGPFEEWFPSTPPTRAQRWRWWIEEKVSRVRRAAAILAGYDDDDVA